MNRKDKHINKFLHDPLPDPEIPADDAWTGMSDMLNAGIGGQGANGSGKLSQIWKSIGKFKGLLITGATVVATSAVVAVVVLVSQTNNQKATLNRSVSAENQGSVSVKDENIVSPENQKSVSDIKRDSVSIQDSAFIQKKEAISIENRGDVAINTRPESAALTSSNKTLAAGNASENSKTHSPGSPRIRTSAQTGASHTSLAHTRNSRDTHIHANARPNGHEAILPPTGKQNNISYFKNGTSPGLAPQQEFASFSTEKNSSNNISGQNTGSTVRQGNVALPSKMTVNLLQPLAGRFKSHESNLTGFIKKPVVNVARPLPKTRMSIFTDLHFGPEWTVNGVFASTEYMFTNADSIKRPARLAIPAIFIAKGWNRHSAIFIFNPLHTYFGDKERVAQRLDTLHMADSTYFINHHNTNFVKAFGINFSLQYQYQAIRWLSLTGGISYARYSSALFLKEIEYSDGSIMGDVHLTAKGREALKSYLRPQQWNLRVGLLTHSPEVFNNRLQVGVNATIPVSNLSLNGFKSVKSPNIQVSLRFFVR